MRVWMFCMTLMMGGSLMAQLAPKVDLYPCPEAGLWGFRNAEGKSVIPAQFHVARRFHEGLAAVRKDARYGFIDSTGAWAIPPKFDGALDFEQGMAQVFRDGLANYVDRQGRLLFQEWFPIVRRSSYPDLFVYWSGDQGCGLMNRQGKRLGPDGYLYLSVDASGSSVAMLNYQSQVSKKARKLASGAAILNAKGKFLLKPQKEEITAFFGGVATMVKSEGEEIVRSYYDTKGKMRFSESDLPGYFLYGDPKFSEGLATILISYAKGDPQKQSRSSYAGVVDMGGKLVFSNREWRSVTQFESGLAFALGHDRLYWPIDRRGKVLSQAGFSYVFTNSARFNYDLLQDGIALAIQGKEVVALDSNGVVKWRNPMMVNGYRWLCRNGDVVYFVDGEGYDLPEYYGFWNTRTGVFSEPNYQQLDYALGEEPAMVGLRSDHFVLLDDAGIEVWQQDEQIAKLPRPQNLDHQVGPIFDFEGKADVSVLEFDEDWEMKSMEVGLMQIEEGKQFVPDAVSIFVADSAQADLMTRSVDWQVALVNTRTDSLALEVHYTNPFAFLQAQDSAGNWRNISGLRFQPRGPDIESYKMPPGYALWAIIPAMEGGFPTKLRIAWALTSNDMKDGKYILSKEFPGSINPGQFHGADCTLFMGFPRLD